MIAGPPRTNRRLRSVALRARPTAISSCIRIKTPPRISAKRYYYYEPCLSCSSSWWRHVLISATSYYLLLLLFQTRDSRHLSNGSDSGGVDDEKAFIGNLQGFAVVLDGERRHCVQRLRPRQPQCEHRSALHV